MTATAENDYFEPGPVSTAGSYSKWRGGFDATLGLLDGVASAANSVGHTITELSDARASWADGQAAWDDVQLSRDEREQAMALDKFKVKRGDNLQLYYAMGAAALAAILIFK